MCSVFPRRLQRPCDLRRCDGRRFYHQPRYRSHHHHKGAGRRVPDSLHTHRYCSERFDRHTHTPRADSHSSHGLDAVQLLSVFARDSGLPANFAKAVVRVEVQDVNDNAPVFARPWYGLEVPENQEPVQLCFLKATDPDSGPGGELQYRITGEEQRCVKMIMSNWCVLCCFFFFPCYFQTK